MRILFGGQRVINLILQNTTEEGFIKWLELKTPKLSAVSHEWKSGRYVIESAYPGLNEKGETQDYRETIKVLVIPSKINTTGVEILCKPITGGAAETLLRFIAAHWPETREAIAGFIEDDPTTAKNAPKEDVNQDMSPLESLLIVGTPSKFAAMAYALGIQLFQAGKYAYAPFWTHTGDYLSPDAHQVIVNFARFARGIIRASWAGPDHTRLIVEYQNASREEIEPLWNILMQEMERLHMIENDGHSKTAEAKDKAIWPVKISRQFEIVDAAVDKHLRELCKNFAGYKREQLTSVSVIYRLHGRWKGVVETRKLDEQLTELSRTEPTPFYLISLTPEQFEYQIQSWEMPSLTDEQKRQQLREEIHKQKIHHEETLREHQGIIDTLLERLKQDGLLQGGGTAQTAQSATIATSGIYLTDKPKPIDWPEGWQSISDDAPMSASVVKTDTGATFTAIPGIQTPQPKPSGAETGRVNNLLMKQRQSKTGKGVELYQEIHLPIEILDAAIAKSFADMGYWVRDLRELDTEAILASLPDSSREERVAVVIERAVRGEVVRDQSTLGTVRYHSPLDNHGQRGMGCLILQKKRDDLTECYLSPPPKYADYTPEKFMEQYGKQLRLTSLLIQSLVQEGYWITQDAQLASRAALGDAGQTLAGIPLLPAGLRLTDQESKDRITIWKMWHKKEPDWKIGQAISKSAESVKDYRAKWFSPPLKSKERKAKQRKGST